MKQSFSFFYFFLVFAHSLSAQINSLPDFGSPADAIMTISQEERLGRSVFAQILNSGSINENPIVDEYINSLGKNMGVYAQDGEFNFRFFVIDDDEVNAFALPGGYIGIHSALIRLTEEENELAGVVAHEIAHVTQRHISRTYLAQQENTIFALATMLAGAILASASNSSDAAAGAMMAGTAAMQQGQINFTRAMETDADRVGVQILFQSGFDPLGMPTMFEKLSRISSANRSIIPEFLQTHPVNVNRIAETRSRANEMRGDYAESTENYLIVRAILEFESFELPTEARSYFESNLRMSGNNQKDLYGIILSLLALNEPDLANLYLSDLVNMSSNLIAITDLQARVMSESGQTDEAIALLANNLSLSPRNKTLTLLLAELYSKRSEPELAHEILLDLFNIEIPTPNNIRTLANYADQMGSSTLSRYYLAEYSISTGQLLNARIQLESVLQEEDLDISDRDKYQARLDQVIEALDQS